MSNGEGKTNNRGELSVKHAFVVAIISAVLGSSGGPLLLDRVFGFNPYRTDPFTGTEGRFHLQRIEALETHVKNHPDVELRASIAELRSELSATNAALAQIVRNQDRILDRLDGR